MLMCSNAKTGGMEDDLNLSSDQYSIIVLVFFISYLVFEVPAVCATLYDSGSYTLWSCVSNDLARSF